jgi:hypothetical protein
MKIEIDEKQLVAEFETALRTAIKATAKYKAEEYSAKEYIKKAIDLQLKSAIDTIVVELLKELPELRDQVRKDLIEKIKRQLSAALKKQGDLV